MNNELAAKIDSFLAEHRQELISDLTALAAIPSICVEQGGDKPFGEPCAQVLAQALALCERNGLAVSNHGNYYGLAELGEGEKTLGIFSHLDVVPEGGGWEYPPYSPTEKDGWLIGRGVCDNKAGMISGLYAMRCLRELNVPLRSKISLYMGCCEETGMNDITRFVAEQPMPDFSIVPDTSFPVCHGEKGILGAVVQCTTPLHQIKSFSGGVASNVMPDYAEARLEMYGDLIDGLIGFAESTDGIEVRECDGLILVCAHGVSAHASMPDDGLSAIWRLAAFLAEARGVDDSDRAIMSMIADTLSDNNGKRIGISASDEPSGELTCISGLASTVDGLLQLDFNIRYPVTVSGEATVGLMKAYFARNGWTMLSSHDSAPCYMPKDDPKVEMLSRIYSDITGKAAVPYVMGGGTYARKLKNAVGFGPETDRAFPFPAGHGGVHQPDECIYIDDLIDAIKIYALSLFEVDRILNNA